MLTSEQLSMRRTLVGASEVAAIVGVPTFFDDLSVWLRKQPIADDGPIPDEPSLAMEMGNALEPLIIARWAEENGRTVIDSRHPEHPGTVRHPRYPHVGATPDGLVVEVPEGLEAKYADGRWGKVWTDDAIPDAYFVQCQINAEVFDRDVWNLAAIVGGEWLTYRIERDRALGRQWCEQVEQWWERHVACGVAPEPKGADSARAYFAHTFPRSNGRMAPATPDDVAVARKLADAKARAKAVENEIELLENVLKGRIGDADGLEGVATWKTDKAGRVAWQKVAEALRPPPELVAQYTGAPARRFLLKVKGA